MNNDSEVVRLLLNRARKMLYERQQDNEQLLGNVHNPAHARRGAYHAAHPATEPQR